MSRTHQNNVKWTEDAIAEALALQDGGMTLATMASHYGLAMSTVKNILCFARRAANRPISKLSKPSAGLKRECGSALPAGHPTTWGIITAGTFLADTPYPTGQSR